MLKRRIVPLRNAAATYWLIHTNDDLNFDLATPKCYMPEYTDAIFASDIYCRRAITDAARHIYLAKAR